MNIEQLENELKKTHIVLRRNATVEDKAKNLVAFAKTLEPDNLAILVFNLIVYLSPVIYRKNLESLLKESVDTDRMSNINLPIEKMDGHRLTVNELISEAQFNCN